jgi:hypothetical protein
MRAGRPTLAARANSSVILSCRDPIRPVISGRNLSPVPAFFGNDAREARMDRGARMLLVVCLVLLLSAGTSAVAKVRKPHHVPAGCHSRDCRSAGATRPDPELGVHGYAGGGGFGGFVGRQGQAGYNW